MAHDALEDPERTVTQLLVAQGVVHSRWMEHVAPDPVMDEDQSLTGGPVHVPIVAKQTF